MLEKGAQSPRQRTRRNSRGDTHGVNAGRAELAHAVVVVEGCVDGIDTNGVDSELLEVGDVALA